MTDVVNARPRSPPAAGRPAQVHLYFHGVSAAAIAAALRQLPHEPGG